MVREPFLPGGGVESIAGLCAKYKVGILELCGDDVRDLLQPEVLVLRERATGMYAVRRFEQKSSLFSVGTVICVLTFLF